LIPTCAGSNPAGAAIKGLGMIKYIEDGYAVLYDRAYKVTHSFPNNEEGLEAANLLMDENETVGVLGIFEGNIILADVKDEGELCV